MTKPGTTPAYVAGTSVTVVDHLDFLCRTVLSGSSTGGAFGLVEERGRRGCMTPRHLHQHEAETFLVLDGAIEGWCEGTSTLVEAGDVLHLPAGREHAFRVASSQAHFYLLVTPGGFESFFAATGIVTDTPFDGDLPFPAPPSREALVALEQVLAPAGVSITGPPPFDASR